MADILSQESDISYVSAESESSDSDDDQFIDAEEQGEWHEPNVDMAFDEFDDSGRGPKHTLDATASVFEYFSLFWGLQLVNLIVEETNR